MNKVIRFIPIFILVLILLILPSVKADPFTSWSIRAGNGWFVSRFVDSIWLNRTNGTGTGHASSLSSGSTSTSDFDTRIRIDRTNDRGEFVMFLIAPVDIDNPYCQTNAIAMVWRNTTNAIETFKDCSLINAQTGFTQNFLYFRFQRTGNLYEESISSDGITWISVFSFTGSFANLFPGLLSESANLVNVSYKGSMFFNSGETTTCYPRGLSQESILLLLVACGVFVVGLKWPILWILSALAGVLSATLIYRDICSIIVPSIISASFILIVVFSYVNLLIGEKK